MKVLVVGGGGREHALAWKLAQSPLFSEVVCAPGNPGTAKVARNVGIAATDTAKLTHLCRHEKIELAIIGPEEPLCRGLADELRAAGVKVFGPGASGARLEGSKLFAKEFLTRHRIPTAAFRRFDRSGAAKAYLESCAQWPQVVKADGLASGKGVFVTQDAREACTVVDAIMEERRLGEAGSSIVVEEHLVGDEVSVLAMVDGQTICVFEPVMDHKQLNDGDSGPNTGGMGVYSPVGAFTQRLQRQVEQNILIPTLHGLRQDEIDYRGILFVGLMLTEAGPRVLEYNCRFGDPECQAAMRRLASDLGPYVLATAEGRLGELEPPQWSPRACVGVVGAAEGYPGDVRRGDVISGLEEAEQIEDVVVFYAGVKRNANSLVTDGGRVVCVTALGDDLTHARESAYSAFERIRWDGKYARRDIGARRAARVR